MILGEVKVNATGYNYIYTPYNVKEISNITFKVKGPRDARVGLFADIKSSFIGEPFYEIIIGGWGRTKCALRKIGATGKLITISDVNVDGYISAEAFSTFWISWADNIIKLGWGATVGKGLLYSYPDNAAPMEINYLAFGALYGISVQYKYYNGLLPLFYHLCENEVGLKCAPLRV